jgi:prepilin peptidase CpaA
LPLNGQLLLLSCLLLLLVAALHDVGVRTVPNGVSVLLAMLGAALRLREGNLAAGFVVGGAAFALATLAWRRGWMGGGDVKLIGAASLALRPSAVPDFLLAASLSGGVLALLYLALAQVMPRPAASRPAGLFARMLRAEQWRVRRRGPLPYASAIAAGAAFTLTLG